MSRLSRSRCAVLTAATLGALVVSLSGVAHAAPEDRQREVDTAIDDLRNDLSGTSADLTAAYASLAATEGRLPVVRANFAAAEQAVADAQARAAALADRLAQAEAAVEQAAAELAAGAEQADHTQGTIGRIAREAYRNGGVGQMSVALQAQSPDDFATRVVLADAAQRSQGDVLADLQVQQADVRAQQARLAAVRAEVADLKAQAEANVVATAAARTVAAQAKVEVEQVAAAQRSAVAVISSRQAEEQQRLSQLETESAQLEALTRRLAQEARARQAAAAAERASARASRSGRQAAPEQRSAPTGSGVLLRPSAGIITSSYGMRIHPITGMRKLHGGVDFAPGCGAPIRAAESGTIVQTGSAGLAGNMTVIDHGIVGDRAMATTYMHQQSFAITSGPVSRGDVIGYVGTTGGSTGCHLHFEVAVDGGRVNPLDWL